MRYRILMVGEAMGRSDRSIEMTGTLEQAKWRARQELRDLYEHVVINIFEDEKTDPVAIKGPHKQRWLHVTEIKRGTKDA